MRGVASVGDRGGGGFSSLDVIDSHSLSAISSATFSVMSLSFRASKAGFVIMDGSKNAGVYSYACSSCVGAVVVEFQRLMIEKMCWMQGYLGILMVIPQL